MPLDIPSDWLMVADAFVENPITPIVFVVGPRKVGKSTMTRYLCNSMWNQNKKVAYLDLDLGQTEFTPPGCLSLKIVQKNPLLGTN